VRCSNRLAATFLIAWAFAFSLGASAQEDRCNTGTFSSRLEARYGPLQCWEKDAQLARRAELIKKDFDAADPTSSRWVAVARDRARLEAGRLPVPGTQPGSAPSIERLGKQFEDALDQLAKLPALNRIDDEEGKTYVALQIASWRPFGTQRSHGEIYLREEKCQGRTDRDAACAAVYEKALEIADSMYLMQRIVTRLRLPLQEVLETELGRRKARWHSYLYDAQFQYWWELGLNRWLEEKCPGGPNALIARFFDGNECRDLKRDPYGNAMEWREPPRFRATALHPDIGFMYNQNDPKGDKVKLSLVFQWFGYQWWKWDKDNKVSDLRGVAIVSTVSDNVVGHPVGIGLQGQWGAYSLAVTSHGDKPVFVFSMNLLDRVSKLDEEWADKLRKR